MRVVPIKESHTLEVTWDIPPTEALYRKAPTNYLSHLLGHEGAGSAFALLKARGLATALSAGGWRFIPAPLRASTTLCGASCAAPQSCEISFFLRQHACMISRPSHTQVVPTGRPGPVAAKADLPPASAAAHGSECCLHGTVLTIDPAITRQVYPMVAGALGA